MLWFWRARRDSNPRPSDPKSGSRQGEQRESIRAWNGPREDAVFVDSGVSLDPAPERVWVPSCELERVRCPRSASACFPMPTTRFRIVRLDADALAGRRLPDHGAKDRVFRPSPTAGSFFQRNYVLTTVTAPSGAPGRVANTLGTRAL